MADFPDGLLEEWGIPESASIRRPESGTMNETWLLEWAGGAAVLRRHRRLARAEVEFEHGIILRVRLGGIPAPAIVPARRGDPLVERDGRFYSVYTWAPGAQVRRGGLDPEQARSMGSMLARIHLVLADLPGGPTGNDPIQPLDLTLGRIDKLLSLARSRKRVELVDDLEARATWLLAHHRDAPPPATAPRQQLIHGDYQDTNVFFERGAVSCVIDWDKARREVPAREVVRALDHGLQLAPARCRAFLAGYRELAPLSAEELEEAAHWFAHQQAQSLWLAEELLLHGNQRVVPLLGAKPFPDLWQAAALT